MNENWPRWFFSSVIKHFENEISDVRILAEGELRDTWRTSNFIECRMDGPSFIKIDSQIWQARIEVNTLVQTAYDETDVHAIHRTLGKVVVAFAQPLLIYEYGDNEEGSPPSLLACLKLLQSTRGREALAISHFGFIDVDKRLLQASVEGHFQGNLE